MPPKKKSGSTSSDGDFVTKEAVQELLQVQERMFKDFLGITCYNLTKRVDDLVKEVSELKASLHYSQEEIDTIKGNVAEHDETLKGINMEIQNLNTAIQNHQPKLTYLENQSRRDNLRIEGLPEDPQETWEMTEGKVAKVLKESLKLDFTPSIVRAHRTGSRTNSQGEKRNKPRTVVCKFHDWKQKECILKTAKKIKPKGIYVNEDLAEDTIRRRKELLPKLIQAREEGKFAYFVLDKLIVRNMRKSNVADTSQHGITETREFATQPGT